MRETTVITVSRKWNNPSIKAFMSATEIGASISLDDFLTALVEEVGNPTMLVSKAALKAKLVAAAGAVVHELKTSTATVV